jgi:hypothetical protein
LYLDLSNKTKNYPGEMMNNAAIAKEKKQLETLLGSNTLIIETESSPQFQISPDIEDKEQIKWCTDTLDFLKQQDVIKFNDTTKSNNARSFTVTNTEMLNNLVEKARNNSFFFEIITGHKFIVNEDPKTHMASVIYLGSEIPADLKNGISDALRYGVSSSSSLSPTSSSSSSLSPTSSSSSNCDYNSPSSASDKKMTSCSKEQYRTICNLSLEHLENNADIALRKKIGRFETMLTCLSCMGIEVTKKLTKSLGFTVTLDQNQITKLKKAVERIPANNDTCTLSLSDYDYIKTVASAYVNFLSTKIILMLKVSDEEIKTGDFKIEIPLCKPNNLKDDDSKPDDKKQILWSIINGNTYEMYPSVTPYTISCSQQLPQKRQAFIKNILSRLNTENAISLSSNNLGIGLERNSLFIDPNMQSVSSHHTSSSSSSRHNSRDRKSAYPRRFSVGPTEMKVMKALLTHNTPPNVNSIDSSSHSTSKPKSTKHVRQSSTDITQSSHSSSKQSGNNKNNHEKNNNSTASSSTNNIRGHSASPSRPNHRKEITPPRKSSIDSNGITASLRNNTPGRGGRNESPSETSSSSSSRSEQRNSKHKPSKKSTDVTQSLRSSDGRSSISNGNSTKTTTTVNFASPGSQSFFGISHDNKKSGFTVEITVNPNHAYFITLAPNSKAEHNNDNKASGSESKAEHNNNSKASGSVIGLGVSSD